MNWARAKNLCLLFLFLLNIFLFVMINVSAANKYKLTGEQKTAVMNLLAKNNISCNVKIISAFKPKKQLSFLHAECNLEKIAKIFFGTEKFSRMPNSFENQNKILSQTENGFQFKNFSRSQKFLSEKEIISYCDLIVKKIKEPSANFILDSFKKDGSKFILDYRQKYRNYIIFDNLIHFNWENNCVNQIDYKYKQVGDFFGSYFEIYPPDMFLYEFIKNDSVMQNDSNVINKFDLIYKTNSSNSNIHVLSPFYRIIYNDDYEMIFDIFSKKSVQKLRPKLS